MSQVWMVAHHPKGDLTVLPAETVCDFNRVALQKGRDGYLPIWMAGSMAEANRLKKEARYAFCTSLRAAGVAGAENPSASGADDGRETGAGAGVAGEGVSGGGAGAGLDGGSF